MQYAGEEHAIALKAFGGGAINEHVGMEVGLLVLDEMTFRASAYGASAKVDHDSTFFSVAVLGRMPVGSATLFTRAGGQFWTVATTGSVDVGGTRYRAKGRKHGMGALLGFGADFALSDGWSLRLEAERYFDVGEDLELKAQGVEASVVFEDGKDVDVLSASLTYSF